MEIEPVLLSQNVAELGPVDQVAAVEDGNAREIRKTRGHKVVVLANLAYGRIWVEPSDDRVSGVHGNSLVILGSCGSWQRAGHTL